MLMDLKQPLAKGASVPVTLRFEDAKGETQHRWTQACRCGTAAPAHEHKH